MLQHDDDPSDRVRDVSSTPVTSGDSGEEIVTGDDGGVGGFRETVLVDEDQEVMAGVNNDSPDSLRRNRSKIADLRAAFERQHDGTSPNGKRLVKRSPARAQEKEEELLKLKEQHEAAVAKMQAQQELKVAQLREQYQTETVSLKRQLGREVEMRQAFEDKCTALEEQIELLQLHLARKDGDLAIELERQTATLQQEKERAQEDTSAVQRQLYELKRGISASTRIDNEVSDSSFMQQFQNLHHEIQNWVVNNYRKTKIEKTSQEMCALLQNIAEPKQLERLTPLFRHFDTSLKIAALQATTVCYMMEIFEEPLLFGLPSQQPWRKNIKKAAETLPAVLSPVSFDKWRSITTDALRQSESEEIKTSLDSAAKSMAEMICITLNTLTEMVESATRITSLQAILRRAITLSHLFRVQRARYDFLLPTTGTIFDPEAMEDTSFSEDHVASKRTVRCGTFPGVTKTEGDSGEDVGMAKVVIKALVVSVADEGTLHDRQAG